LDIIEARGKNFWSSERQQACLIGQVVTKINEVKIEKSVYDREEAL
jgi:hypothetical protein